MYVLMMSLRTDVLTQGGKCGENIKSMISLFFSVFSFHGVLTFTLAVTKTLEAQEMCWASSTQTVQKEEKPI